MLVPSHFLKEKEKTRQENSSSGSRNQEDSSQGSKN
jgi:hypothetical protein